MQNANSVPVLGRSVRVGAGQHHRGVKNSLGIGCPGELLFNFADLHIRKHAKCQKSNDFQIHQKFSQDDL